MMFLVYDYRMISNDSYVPSKEVLQKYARVLVKYALNSGEGVKPNEIVLLSVPESAKPLLWELQEAILESQAHYITMFLPTGTDRRTMGNRLFYELASEDQINFFPDKFYKGLVDQIDHQISIIADDDLHALDGISPSKILTRQQSLKPYWDWRNDKENHGKFTWTLALYGTSAMASEAEMPLNEYWEQIIKACYLDEDNPIVKWQSVTNQIDSIKNRLNQLPIEKLHLEARDTDLWITLGENRQWLGGSGRNIPSFEIFTSPDWRGTNGTIYFNQPLYLYGQKATGIKLRFENGVVVESHADEGSEIIKQMIETPNANKIGEFSLTDGRLSRITRFMANTLFDENVGGVEGNTHLALGMSYKDTCSIDLKNLDEKQFEEWGFNDSSVHTDIMSTTPRTVTAVMKDGSAQIIYQNGEFIV